MDAHMGDGTLHLVAPPGSGKTVLGLELARRIGRPALILSPSRAVRDQWMTRLADFGLDRADVHSICSVDLEAPGLLTSTTYQALSHAARSGGLERLARTLADSGAGTFVLDEAHHLHSDWWTALTRLIALLEDVRIVALTATPPYDVSGAEWKRYVALCGPIDEEIGVPELVRTGTLCPHQDYVWATRPTAHEHAALTDYESALASARRYLESSALASALSAHEWAADPNACEEAIFEHPEEAAALLIFLAHCGKALPARLLALLDVAPDGLPRMSGRWWSVLVGFVLSDAFSGEDESRIALRASVHDRLRSLGVLWRGRLRIGAATPTARLLSGSSAKIRACVDVHRIEREARGDGLRQVVLCDYIRADEPDRLGALPVFSALHADLDNPGDVALLTGSRTWVHASRTEALKKAARETGQDLAFESVSGLPGVCSVTVDGGGSTVGLVTRLLGSGAIRTTVGTRALLGEGWDAPAVNSLVIASHVGAHVGTNQMRGRAIRRDAHQPDKVASIWHLVAVAGEVEGGDSDLHALLLRAQTFAGLSVDMPIVESGSDRLRLPSLARPESVDLFNATSLDRFGARDTLSRRWLEASGDGRSLRMAPSLGTASPPPSGPYFFRSTLRYTLLVGAAAAWAAASWMWNAASGLRITALGLPNVLFFAALAALMAAAFPLSRALRGWMRAAPVDGALRSIARVVFGSLQEAGHLSADLPASALRTETTGSGVFWTTLDSASLHEQSVFMDALAEVLSPIQNPRYVVTRNVGGARVDYHAVPSLLDRKADAERFVARWQRLLGPADLTYARSKAGRRQLLRARARSFSSAYADSTERRDRWQ